jgi:hypothetical protein
VTRFIEAAHYPAGEKTAHAVGDDMDFFEPVLHLQFGQGIAYPVAIDIQPQTGRIEQHPGLKPPLIKGADDRFPFSRIAAGAMNEKHRGLAGIDIVKEVETGLIQTEKSQGFPERHGAVFFGKCRIVKGSDLADFKAFALIDDVGDGWVAHFRILALDLLWRVQGYLQVDDMFSAKGGNDFRLVMPADRLVGLIGTVFV